MKKLMYLISVVCLIIGTLTSCEWENSGKKYAAVKLVDSKMWSIVDLESGELIYKDEFSHEPSAIVGGVFYVVNDEGLYDVYNISDVKKPINKEPYKSITIFDDQGEALAVKPGGCITLINKKCKVVKEFKPEIKVCNTFEKNGTAIYLDISNKMGLINRDGKIIIKANYDIIDNSGEDDEIIVGKRDKDKGVIKYDIIDKKQKVSYSFTSSEYEAIGVFKEGLLPVKKAGDDNEIYFINKKGEKSTKFGAGEEYGIFSYGIVNGITAFLEGESYGLKNKEGDVLIRAKYENVSVYSKNVITVKKNDKWGIINVKDEIVLPFEYEGFIYLTEDRFITGNSKMVSLIDLKGKDISPYNFEDISLYGRRGVRSNYFDPVAEVKKIVSLFTGSSCNNISSGSTLRAFKHLLSYSEYYYKGDYTLEDNSSDNNVEFTYVFNAPIARETYEYYWGYRFSNGTSFNYDAKCVGVLMTCSLEEYPATAETEFVKEFEKEITGMGFQKGNKTHYYKNSWKPDGANVGVGYKDGKIVVYYYFDEGRRLDIVREKRGGTSKKENDDYSEVIDSVEVVDTVAAW